MVMQWYHAKTDARPQNTLEWTMEQTMEFLQQGQVTIPIPNTNDNDLSNNQQTPCWMLNIKKLPSIYVKVHGVRKDTHQCCCLHETGEHTWDVVPHTNARASPATTLPVGHLFLGPQVPILLENSGKDLETRLARGDREPGGFELLVLVKAGPRGGLLTTDNNIAVPTGSTSSSVTANTDLWQVHEVTFQLWANYSDQIFVFESQVQPRKHGVTMLHVLDQLEGWN